MPLAYRVVRFQAMMGIVIGVVAWVLSYEDGVAAAVGGAVVWLPSALFAWRLERESNPQRVVGYGAARVVLTILGLAGVLATMDLAPAGFFAGIIGQYLSQAVGGWWIPGRHNKKVA